MTRREIVKEIKRRCRIFGVRLIFEDKRNGDDVSVAGYFDAFDDSGPLISMLKINDDDIFCGILLHEYCHVTQWVENCTVWREDNKMASRCDMDGWIGSGKKLSNAMKRTFELRRELEADCERRTVRLIRELQAPVDLPRYIQRANSYIHFYNTIPVTNQWYHPDKVPYLVDSVNKMFRSDRIEDDFTVTPKRKFNALVRCSNTPH